MAEGAWKVCSSCKKPIGFEQTYYLCSVSTCRSKRTGMFFCSVPCFEAHLPMMRHRDAWAEQETAPTKAQAEAEAAEAEHKAATPAEQPTRRRVLDPKTGELQENTADLPKDVLVVASKLKKYVKARSNMNTSDTVLPVLSDHLRRLCILALRRAAEDGRKTVMDRDFAAVIRELDA